MLPSNRGPAMTPIDGGVVRIGPRQLPAAAGYQNLAPPPGGDPGGRDAAPARKAAHDHVAPQAIGGAQAPLPGAGAPPIDVPPVLALEIAVGDFAIDLTEVTRGQYASFLADTGYRPPYVAEPWADEGWNWYGIEADARFVDHPVVLINVYDAAAFCAWAGKRLPTEAEWQLAVLGDIDEDRVWPWGADYDGSRFNHGRMFQPSWDDTDGYAWTSPVGAYPQGKGPNGLVDGFGNAWEWASDLRTDDPADYSYDEKDGDRLVNGQARGLGLYGAIRGGSYWTDLQPNPAGERGSSLLELRRKSTGFRCARDL